MIRCGVTPEHTATCRPHRGTGGTSSGAGALSIASLAIAAVAALCNALASTLQRKANRDLGRGRRFGPRLFARLVGDPMWLLGVTATTVSFVLQAIALKLGTLSSVEPVLIIELPLTLIIGAHILRERLPRGAWLASLATAAGLALFIATLNPHGGDAGSTGQAGIAWAAVATALGVGALLGAAWIASGAPRAMLLGAAAGTGFGLTASLLKAAVADFDRGIAAFATDWTTWGFLASGIASFVLVQAALHWGTLIAAQPGITLLDPLVSLIWGTAVFSEIVRTGPVLLLAGLGAAVTVAGVQRLSVHASAE